jgi:hypothetical protein
MEECWIQSDMIHLVSGNPDPLLFGTGMDPTIPFHGQKENGFPYPDGTETNVPGNLRKWWFQR